MAFDFIQKKFDKYVDETANRVFNTACNQLMALPLISPLVTTVTTTMVPEPHFLTNVTSRVKDLFSHAGMHAEILFDSNGMSVEFKMNVFDSQEVLESEHIDDFFWSRSPGKFVNKMTGQPVMLASSLAQGPTFDGTVREWYECLVETCIDASNRIHEYTKDSPAEIIRCGPDVLTIFECSVLYRPSFSVDNNSSPYEGMLSNRFKVIKDMSMERNKIEVSRVRNNKKSFSIVTVMDMNII